MKYSTNSETKGGLCPPITAIVQQCPCNTSSEQEQAAIDSVLSAGPELMKRLYYHPEYQEVIRLYGAELVKRLDNDPEALAAFKELFIGESVDLGALDSTDRIAPLAAALWIGGSFAAGAVLGYFAEKGKAEREDN